MKKTLKQINRRRRNLGYSEFSILVNSFHIIRLGLLMKIQDFAVKHSLYKPHKRP